MRIFSKTIKYAAANFHWLLLGFLLPAFVYGFFSGRQNFLSFIFEYPSLEVKNYLTILGFFIDFKMLKYVVPFILFAVSVVLTFSLVASVVEGHLRLGKVSFAGPFGKINNSVITILAFTLIGFAAYVICAFLLSSILFLSHIIFSGSNGKPAFAAIMIAYVLIIVFIAASVYVIEICIFVIPAKLVVGYAFSEGFAVAAGLLYKKHLQIYFYCLVPFLVCFFMELIFFLTSAVPAVGMVVRGLFALLTMIYYTAFSFVGYFELAMLKRMDGKRKYYEISE